MKNSSWNKSLFKLLRALGKFRILRLTIYAILLSVVQGYALSGYARATKLNLAMENASVKEVLLEIENMTKFRFLYNSKIVNVERDVTVQFVDLTIDKAMDVLFSGTDVEYTIIDRQIVLSAKGSPSILLSNYQQPRTISGKISDNSGLPLTGVTIVIKGTTQGTVTDIDGQYLLTGIPENAILVFSFVGMRTQEIAIGNQSSINIIMQEETIGLEEVVAIGYGTQKKATLTGSVASISDKEIMKTPTPNLSNSLAGLMPGLVAMNRSGAPGADNSTFLVRGNSTTGNNTPLVLVDGIAEPGWERISSNDIESISVLKDAAAAIYGVQAANGVILITTKRGQAGKPMFNFTYNQGFIQPTRIPEMASSATLAEYGNDYLLRTGFEPRWTEEQIQKFRDGSDPLRYPNTNWSQEMLKTFALQESANLNIRGGAENIRYSVSSSYQHKDDIIKNGLHDFRNYSIRSNIDSDISKNITLSLDLNMGKDERNQPIQSSWFYIYAANPQYPVYWPGGYPANIPSDYGENPVITHTGGSGYDKTNVKRFSGKFSFDIKVPIIKGLGIDGYFVYNDNYTYRKRWATPWEYYEYNFDTSDIIPRTGGTLSRPTLTEDFTGNSSQLLNFRIKFERRFNNHNINTFIAGEQSKGKSNFLSAFRRDFLAEAIDEMFAGSAANLTNDGYSSENARQNLFGRLNYNYLEKYLFDFNFRYDGSYRFPKGSRWGFFPGVAVAWRLSEENFIKNNFSFLENLKLRASHGQIGNDAISAFQFLQQYNLRSIGYHFGAPLLATPQAGVYSGVSPNPNITWEVAQITNIGFDVMLPSNIIGFSIDMFKQKRSNILTTRGLELPVYTGLTLPNENIGIVENKGIELELSHQKTLNDFSYRLAGNISFARSRVIDVSEAQDVPEYQKAEGHILGAQLLYEAIGIFRTEEELNSTPAYPGSTVGDLIYKDVNNDGKINSADMVRFDKSIIPEITYGFNISTQYKNFDLFAHFAGQGRAWWYIHQHARVDQNGLKELLENRYTPGSMDSKYPWIPQFTTVGTDISGMASTFWLQNAAFLRLKTLELSYNLPPSAVQQFKIDGLRIFVNGSNLLTFSKIKWFDPEGSNQRGLFYPQSKIFNLGIQIKF